MLTNERVEELQAVIHRRIASYLTKREQGLVMHEIRAVLNLESKLDAETTPRIDMVLHCPNCHVQHIDGPEDREIDKGSHVDVIADWTNPPHRSHLCRNCQHIWRPADVPTNGVASVKTKGKNDSAPTARLAVDAEPVTWRGLTRHQCNAIEYFVTQMRDEPTAVYIDMFDAFRDYINSLVDTRPRIPG